MNDVMLWLTFLPLVGFIFIPALAPWLAALIGGGGIGGSALAGALSGGGGTAGGQPQVPLDPRTGQPIAIDPMTGISQDYVNQLWQMEAPAGTPDAALASHPQYGLPNWVVEVVTSPIEGNPGVNWLDLLRAFTQDPRTWGFSLPTELTGVFTGLPALSGQPPVNEGQVVDYPEGQQPGGTPEDPVFSTTVTGAPEPIPADLGAALGGGALLPPPIFNNPYLNPTQQPDPTSPGFSANFNPYTPPVAAPSNPAVPGATGPAYVDPATGMPVYTATGTTTPYPVQPTPSPLPTELSPPIYPPVSGIPPVPTPSPLPTTLPQAPLPGVTVPPTTQTPPSGLPEVPIPGLGAALGGAGGGGLPGGLPVVGGGQPTASLFAELLRQRVRPPQSLAAILAGGQY